MDRRLFVSALAGVTAVPGLSSVLLPTFAPGAMRRLLDAADVAKSRGVDLLRADAPAWQGSAAIDAAFASDEDFWEPVQRAFDLDRSWINLNNGGCSPAPTHVLDQMIREAARPFGDLRPRQSAVTEHETLGVWPCRANRLMNFGHRELHQRNLEKM